MLPARQVSLDVLGLAPVGGMLTLKAFNIIAEGKRGRVQRTQTPPWVLGERNASAERPIHKSLAGLPRPK